MTGCRPVVLRLALTLMLGLGYATDRSEAAPYDGQPKILLHLAGVTAKSACLAGQLADCNDAVTAGTVGSASGPYYFAYVLAARGNLPDLAGLQFGIRYQEGCVTGKDDNDRLDVLGWTSCGTFEFFTGGFFAWPGPNSGNLIVWDSTVRCQTGGTAVAGFFYVACYGAADTLRIIPRPVDHWAKVARCNSTETFLGDADLGSIVFSPSGSSPGCNPCHGPCPSPPTYLPCGTGDVTPPARMTLALQERTATSITVQWQAPGDDGNGGGPAATYDLRYWDHSPLPGDPGMRVGTVPTPAPPGSVQTAILFGLTSNHTYYFRIRAADEAMNWSDESLTLDVTTLTPGDMIAPAAIYDLAPVRTGLDYIRLGWTATGDNGMAGVASSYEMRRSVTPIAGEADFESATLVEGLPAPDHPGRHQEVNATGLDPDTPYYFAIRVRDEAGNLSSLSNVATARTKTLEESMWPDAISDLTALAATLDLVLLDWTATGDDGSVGTALRYDIRYSASPITTANWGSATQVDGEPAPYPGGSHQQMLVTDLEPLLQYYFAMTVEDDEGNVSGLSNVVVRQTSINEPTLLFLHIQPVATVNPCAAGQVEDCFAAITGNAALLPARHFIYLLATNFTDLSGISCGVQYDLGATDGDSNHRGLDIYSWSLCADGESPSSWPAWPKPGSGNLITWSETGHCQTSGIALAGYFYVGAYSVDQLQLTPRIETSFASVFDCAGQSQDLSADALGAAGFGRTGRNPCQAGHPLPIQPTSWSRIKTLIGR